MPGILRRQPQGGQRIRHDVGSRGKVLPGSSGKVHDALDAGEHVVRLPAGHGHVVHRLRRLGRGELGLAAHLTGLIPQGFQVLPGRPGHSRHLAHGGVEVGSHLHGSRAKPAHRRSDGHQLLPHTLNGGADRL